MATKKAATKQAATKQPAKRVASAGAFTAEERAAMKERARETRKGKVDGEADLLAKIAEMDGDDRSLAERIHALVTDAAPGLQPKTWYGMPAYAKEGKVVCFFQPSGKFKARYSTFGFNDSATLDAGSMWPTSFALTDLTAADEAKLRRLVKKAVR
jgi:uncharacterized protein YdhG (YjbR/CyaY superfamily)